MAFLERYYGQLFVQISPLSWRNVKEELSIFSYPLVHLINRHGVSANKLSDTLARYYYRTHEYLECPAGYLYFLITPYLLHTGV